MNLQDKLAELILPCIDALLNLITLGFWKRIRGAQRSLRVKRTL